MIHTDYNEMYNRLAQLRKSNGLYDKPTSQNKKSFEEVLSERMIPECTGDFSYNSSNFTSYNERCSTDHSSNFAFG